jgi:hypothetical protein
MAIGTFTLLRRPSLKPFDLSGTSLHGFIEHNASLTRDDVPDFFQFGCSQLDIDRLHEFLDKAHHTASSNGEDVITSEDIAAHRIVLEKKTSLDSIHAEIARAEFAMVMEIFGHGKKPRGGPKGRRGPSRKRTVPGWLEANTDATSSRCYWSE